MTGMISVITQGLILSIMALGIYITYKILDFPDLSVDGSFALGGAIIAFSLTNNISPIVGTVLAIICGLISGLVTGILHIKFKISNLLSGILVMGMLYSINLGIMGKSNVPLFNFNHLFNMGISPLVLVAIIVLCCKFILDLFLTTGLGYTLKAVGDNPQMVKSLGIDIDIIKILGLMLSNGLVSLSGSLFAQFQGFSDVNLGIGTLVLGIASIIIGMSIFKRFKFIKTTTSILVGTLIYQFTIYFAINLGIIPPNNLKLITSIVIILFLSVGNLNVFANKKNSKILKKRDVADVTN
ncbi:MAG: ABC transporter permease [Clostridium argentinense]|uniref:ABC transporter permease n=1 Tax=Clostridium butanoliproducens TaxID=2991837 RepID=UPI001E020203|nr:ABC transporter permease [Clostridium butanoliproducens]MBS5822941.1 ABC transporter permease [Clostridium argentinense]MDU1349812.1 ABC transporter permease [Clostridium argentinense]